MRTFAPIKAFVTRAWGFPPDVRRTTRGGFTTRRDPAWSGQRSPTGAAVMHSVQIGRPHSEQERPVSRSGGREQVGRPVCLVDIRTSVARTVVVHVAFTPGEQTAAPVGIVVDVLRATSTVTQ